MPSNLQAFPEMSLNYQQKEADIGQAPDLDSSTDEYAARFSGAAGAWLIGVQSDLTGKHIALVGPNRILDVGGGHAQNVTLIEGLKIPLIVSGSSEDCSMRVERYRNLTTTQFECSPLHQLKFGNASFPHLISYRIVSHMSDWSGFIRELCRVSDDAVTIDFASRRSINLFSELAYSLKKGQEGDTRRYHVLSEKDVDDCFADVGYKKAYRTPQFFWPMAIHRKLNLPRVSKVLELLAKITGLTWLFGSPVIVTYRKTR